MNERILIEHWSRVFASALSMEGTSLETASSAADVSLYLLKARFPQISFWGWVSLKPLPPLTAAERERLGLPKQESDDEAV